MGKVITVSGLSQSGSLRGWNKCDPIEALDSKGKTVIRCGQTMTLSGTSDSCKPRRKKTKRGQRCMCGNRFVKSARCAKRG